MSESFSVSIRVVSSFILGEAPGGIYLWGASFCPLGCPLLFFGLGKEKKQKKLHSQGLSARIERALSAPLPSVGGRSHGCAALYFEVAHPCSLYR